MRIRFQGVGAAIVLVLASGFQGAEPERDTWSGLLEDQRFIDALKLAQEDENHIRSAQRMQELHHHAGDLSGALRAGLEGLVLAPDDLHLLWRSARLAGDLAQPVLAQELTSRLRSAITQADDLLSDEHLIWWQGASQELEQETAALLKIENAKAAAVTRARWVAASALVLAALAIARTLAGS